ncbi:DUF1996 domain-containing protein [Streptomyces sp. TRM S81-3]|uniref:DUF1996 domain-containing protein n=1 Tax=Streptomyces griseicoloratus TaxID=2752516 RepID=A0A926L790_9ACTN|nr:DUF1996 domain-containing protein [Streptomyces griseicoloratus]MBD0423275.1 DUF1996 domain-containing protein [Streptomyces griseicoloratus]
MGHNRRRRPTGARRATFAAAALILGGGGLVAVNVYASATAPPNDPVPLGTSGVAATVDCPDPSERLTTVPEQARSDVDTELARLDEQIAAAYRQLQETARAADDGTLDESALLDPLAKERAATIERITAAIDRAGDRPEGLEALADCSLRRVEVTTEDAGTTDGGQDGAGRPSGGEGKSDDGADAGQPGNGGQAGNGPVAGDYADITTVRPEAAGAREAADASRGTFTTSCGVNAEGLFNSDNVIAAPGVTNGAHHFHDYVGNQANNAFAGDDDLAAADTSCADQRDKSSYYWPVLRLQNGTREQDAESPGGGIEGNAGEIVTPAEVTLTFVGNERGEVTAMPRLLRIITGDAKAFVNGTANANASWSCTGFEDRQLKDKYPLCPAGSDVVRTFTFQSCWDGRNTDSANHRTHVAFAAADGSCPDGFRPIPRLVQRIVYDVDAPSLRDGGRTTPLFAVDSFPEQLHKPVTDHSDFINVFDEDLMREMVDCINSGRECGAGAPPAPDPGESEGEGENPQEQPTQTPAPESPDVSETPDASETPDGGSGQDGQNGQNGRPGVDNGENENNGENRDDDQNKDNGDTAETTENPPPPAQPQQNASGGPAPKAAATTAPEVTPDADAAAAAPASEPQATRGGLAETGSGLGLWPAAAGGVLVAVGCLVLFRSRRRTG